MLTSEDLATCLSRAYARAIQLAPAAVSRESGCRFDEALTGLITNLVGTLKVPSASAILSLVDTEFLQKSIQARLGEVICVVQDAIAIAREASELQGASQDQQVERAAGQLATAAGKLVRLILQGIVTNARAGKGLVRDQDATRLLHQLRAGRLGTVFASWVEKNWKDLMRNPAFEAKPRLAGRYQVDRFVFQRKPPAPTVTQPPSDPPSFPSDVDLVTQANTLVAAAAQGKPFCPE